MLLLKAGVVPRAARLEGRELCQAAQSCCPGLPWQVDGAAGSGRGGKSNVKMKRREQQGGEGVNSSLLQLTPPGCSSHC